MVAELAKRVADIEAEVQARASEGDFGGAIALAEDNGFVDLAQRVREAQAKAQAKEAKQAADESFRRRLRISLSGPVFKTVEPAAPQDQPKAKTALGDRPGVRDFVRGQSEAIGQKPKIGFHSSDLDPVLSNPMTAEEKIKALHELADLRQGQSWEGRLEFPAKREELARRLCINIGYLDQMLDQIDKEKGDIKQKEATKVAAIALGDGVQLWNAELEGYASVWYPGNEGYWRNFQIKAEDFRRWLRSEYGGKNRIKINEKWVSQAVSAGVIKDAAEHLEAIATMERGERKIAMRVGGDRDVVLIDLGDDTWQAVKVTRDGWRLVPGPRDLAFIRRGRAGPLPIPARGGSIQSLRPLLNIHTEDFVLVVAWLLSALCALGDYPHLYLSGRSEMGKTTVSRIILEMVDPSVGPRAPVKKTDDLGVAVSNSWLVGWDNLTHLNRELSDMLCRLSTGLAIGTRRFYTNGEEFLMLASRPFLFNGIKGDLVTADDLWSRTIRLEIPPLAEEKKVTKEKLQGKLVKVWPAVFGALLDGVAGAIRGWRDVKVAKPARLADFESWAEAGCQAMGFEPGEFIRAYEANRKGSLLMAAESNPVVRAAKAFLENERKRGRAEVWVGKMSDLYTKLLAFRDDASDVKEWPKTPSLLGSAFTDCARSLEVVGIGYDRPDRRKDGGIQKEVSLWLKPPAEPGEAL